MVRKGNVYLQVSISQKAFDLIDTFTSHIASQVDGKFTKGMFIEYLLFYYTKALNDEHNAKLQKEEK